MIELHDYQREAIKKLRTGSILCGGVGSGKSRTSLAYYFSLEYESRRKGRPKKLYIITTARKRDTNEWVSEIDPFGIQDYTIDSWNNIKKYSDVKDAFFIFDEQRVVGYGSWTKSFLRITKENEWILLSATPGDTWMDYMPVFIANGFYKNKTDFCDRHVVWSRVTKYPQVKGYMNKGLLIKHRNDILVDMDYQKSTESYHENVPVQYDQVLYNSVMTKRWNIYEDRPIMNVSELCMVLRRIVNTDDSRVAAVEHIMDEHPKAIIFYRYDFELETLKNLMITKGYTFAQWNGHVHEPIPKAERWAYLVQYTAGSEGWNCIETDTMIFYSDDYSYKVMTQAAGRIDRMNTPFHILYYFHLKSKSQIDQAISRALKSKKNFNERGWGGHIDKKTQYAKLASE